MKIRKILVLALFAGSTVYGESPAVEVGKHDAPRMGNPILPGYFADPTVRKFGDTYYLYATTDGTSGGTGPSQVWISKDFVNWVNLPMNWPNTKFIWAPEVVQDKNGLYYFYYSQPCQIHVGVSETPIGPWRSVEGESVQADGLIVPNQYLPPVITLDWQMFDDDDGKRYGMFCTWAIYPGHGCGMVEVGEDMLPIESTKWMVPNTELPDIFEAPYMLKKDGVYYLMYSSGSCHDHTYRVQYATATDIKGPYKYDKVNNPILGYSEDMTVHGPGHHGMLEVDGEHYIIYHRHDNPNSGHGMHRQIAADRMEFGPNHTIKPVVPTHNGIGFLGENTNPFDNLTFSKSVKASSFYDERYKPEFAVDDNNGTLWTAADNTFPQTLNVDLGTVQSVKRTWTQFQYANWYYQYMIEYSVDGKNWKIFSDKRNNQLAGSPMVDFGDVQARYLRLTITGLEKPGLYAAVWNFKAFTGAKEDPPQLLVHLEADDLEAGTLKNWVNNKGMIGGSCGVKAGAPEVKAVNGKNAVVFSGDDQCSLDKLLPETLKATGVYSQTAWVYSNSKWQFIATISDGQNIEQYVDGEKVSEIKITGKDAPEGFALPMAAHRTDGDVAYASVRIYARALFPAEVKHLMETAYQKPAAPTPAPKGLLVDLNAADLKIGPVKEWKNKGLDGQAFKLDGGSPMVEMVAGVKAVTFKGADSFKSTFPAPATLNGNANYTVAVWAFNPEVADVEFMVSWSDHGGLDATSARLGFGRNSSWGAVAHSGWADIGYKTVPSACQWHHIAVTFDGLVEKVYIDGKLDNSEDKMLFVAGAKEMFLGRGHGAPEFFSGSLATVQVYDKGLTADQIREMAAQKPSSDVLFNVNTGGLDYGPVSSLENSGSLGGSLTAPKASPKVCDVNGRIALAFAGNEQLLFKGSFDRESDYSVEAFVLPVQGADGLVSWEGNAADLLFPKMLDGKQWRHIVLTKDGCYVDGKAVPAAGEWLKASKELVIGKGFKGALSQLVLYSRTLSKEDVADLYNAITTDLQAPAPVHFETAPMTITPNAIGMVAVPASDESGWVQYYFEEASGGNSGWISKNEYESWGLEANKTYAYTVRVRDYYGNVSAPSQPAATKTATSMFKEYADDFAKSRDYLSRGTSGTIWDGRAAEDVGTMKVLGIESKNGALRLESTSASIDAEGGPFLYKTVEGDFVAEAKVADIQGWQQRTPPGLLEPMLMVRVADEADAGDGVDQIRSGIFPYWNCGNLWTSLDGGGRPQGHNQSGYDADLYLQIERRGDRFILRTSPDGASWKVLPGMPLHRPDMAGLPLQVGLAMSLGDGDETGWVEFDWFKVLIRK